MESYAYELTASASTGFVIKKKIELIRLIITMLHFQT